MPTPTALFLSLPLFIPPNFDHREAINSAFEINVQSLFSSSPLFLLTNKLNKQTTHHLFSLLLFIFFSLEKKQTGPSCVSKNISSEFPRGPRLLLAATSRSFRIRALLQRISDISPSPLSSPINVARTRLVLFYVSVSVFGIAMVMERRNGLSGSYYAVLGVRPGASCSEIRSAYRKLAMRWHPDRCGREPRAVDEAKRRFQQIQEAYQVLSDEGKRALYDAGLYDPFEEDEEVEGFSDFVQEMLGLMSNVRREGKDCSLEELQRMLAEMAQGFDSVPSFSAQCFNSGGSDPNRGSKRSQCEEDPMARRQSHLHVSGFKVFGSTASYC